MKKTTRQKKITSKCDLLDDDGLLTAEGYATTALLHYDRAKIKAAKHRIKEWDYYYVVSPENGYGITFTISDLGYIGLTAICWLDFKNRKSYQTDSLSFFPMGNTGLSAAPTDGKVSVRSKKVNLSCEVEGGTRTLVFSCPDFNGSDDLCGEITLHQDLQSDSMVIATSWKENRRAFYYNQKTNCMPAEGVVKIGDKSFEFSKHNSFAGLDWGRGNWTYENQWYWGSASGLLDGKPFGFNIGYGFSDRSAATENMLFYEGAAHKLGEVEFIFDVENYMAPWRFVSNDGRFELDFEPIMDRSSSVKLLVLKSSQHQVFGYFSGFVILDDGTKLNLNRFFGFAEDVFNRW